MCNLLSKIKQAITDLREQARFLWKDGMDGACGFRRMDLRQWEETKIYCIVAAEDSPYRRWDDVPTFRRKSVEFRGNLLRWALKHSRLERVILFCNWVWDYRLVLKSAQCAICNHDWCDDSHAGPDSGSMAGTCTRCGYSFSHTMY